MTPPLTRQLTECAISFARAYDACNHDAHAARERILRASDEALDKLLAPLIADLAEANASADRWKLSAERAEQHFAIAEQTMDGLNKALRGKP